MAHVTAYQITLVAAACPSRRRGHLACARQPAQSRRHNHGYSDIETPHETGSGGPWSPDGTLLARQIVPTLNLRPQDQARYHITNDPGQDVQPAFSPTALPSPPSLHACLAHRPLKTAPLAVSVFPSFGDSGAPALGDPRRLALGGNSPVWSLDGKKLAF
jgi:hypothetical protein